MNSLDKYSVQQDVVSIEVGLSSRGVATELLHSGIPVSLPPQHIAKAYTIIPHRLILTYFNVILIEITELNIAKV